MWRFHAAAQTSFPFLFHVGYESMDLEMLREVVPMLRQQLEKSMLDRNYVQLERVGVCIMKCV